MGIGNTMKNILLVCSVIGSLYTQIAMAQLQDIRNIGKVLNKNNFLIQQSLQEVQAAQEQTRILIQAATNSDQKERLRYVNERLDRTNSLLAQLLAQPSDPITPPYTPPVPIPHPGSVVELYRSDSCLGELIGTVAMGTQCSNFDKSQVWAIKTNGKCMDIQDMGGVQACETFREAGNPNTISLFKSDSCSSSLTSVVSVNTNCESLSNENSAWAVSIGGQCKDLEDMSPQMACKSLRGAASPVNVEIYGSDSCTGGLVAIIDHHTQCQSLQGLNRAWGIKINGQCQNISDTDAVTACERFKP